MMQFPTAAKRLIKRDELLGCRLLSADILFVKIEFLALGVEDIQIICQAAVVSIRCELGRLTSGRECPIKVLQAVLFGRVGGDRIVDLLDGGQYRLFVTDQDFMCAQLGNVGY